MANTAANVSTGKPAITGGIYRAPAATAAPTDATTSLAAGYKCLGYCNEDGITEQTPMEEAEIKAWGGDIVDSAATSFGKVFTFTLIESSNIETLKAVYGDDNVTSSGTPVVLTTKSNATALAHGVWVFEMVKKGGKLLRTVISDGKITEIGDIVYKDGEPIGYPVTLRAFPDSNGDYTISYETTPAAG